MPSFRRRIFQCNGLDFAENDAVRGAISKVIYASEMRRVEVEEYAILLERSN